MCIFILIKIFSENIINHYYIQQSIIIGHEYVSYRFKINVNLLNKYFNVFF